MMTPEEISDHFRLVDHDLWEMPDAERAERLTRLEAALATDPPEDLAKRLRMLVGCFQPRRPLTLQEAIDQRFTDNHARRWPYTCGTWATRSFPGHYDHPCVHEALLEIASALRNGPAVPATTLDGRRDLEFNGDGFVYHIEPGNLGALSGTCTCPHDCAWSGPLRNLWIEGGHVVCQGCHEACPASS